MKPSKNHVLCIGCRRNKMLFTSQAKAERFLSYNYAEIARHSDKTPSRIYYCTFCCGWHVTSIEDEKTGKICDQHDAELWDEIEIRCRFIDIENDCHEIENLLDFRDYEEAKKLIEQTMKDFMQIKHELTTRQIDIKALKHVENLLRQLETTLFLSYYTHFPSFSKTIIKEKML